MNSGFYLFPEKSRFLVTGGAGFIGSAVCEALLGMGHPVRCLDDLSTGSMENIRSFSDNPQFEFIRGDIRDFETCMAACQGMDYVSHQAAWGSVPRSIEMPLLYEDINVRGTLNMLEAARQNGVRRFVYASSSSVYGDEPALPKKEGREGNVLSPYALTKRTAEEYAGLYTRLYGLETIGFRYFNVFGKRQNPDGAYAAVIPRFVKSLMAGKAPVINGDGSQSRDFTYVENAVEANLKGMLAPKAAAGAAYNIACGAQTSLNSLHQKLCVLLDRHIAPVYGPERQGDIRHSNADISAAENMLGYSPEYSFERGLEQTIGWYRKNL
ncbi:SDR family oxidoreductase [Eubacterium sp. 1001713B170207_170306_E7]|uniref:SDR family oxidoreductase n=1 Tax=Eubacterium sp. 1001713B170207_170306_E7 TaxID=2787097 RepID=UPI0018978815|nr:SDR family oxidoreductase [Eubacterium sp. 1001713B170207_170306_E7]